MTAWLELTILVLSVSLAVVGLVAIMAWLTSRSPAPRCTSCGASLQDADAACLVCEAPLLDHAGAPTEAAEPQAIITVERRFFRAADGSIMRAAVRPWMIRGALGIMFLGLGIRLLGMLEPMGLQLGVPDSVTAVLTVLGGTAAFLGFVVLDVA